MNRHHSAVAAMPTANAAIKKVAVIIPCYNEAAGIANVIGKFPHDRLTRNLFDIKIIVVDNNSTDDTAKVAKKAGATVISEARKGKGHAIRTGFANVPDDTDYVVMLDGDDTYESAEILRLIEPLSAGFCSVVIGSRLSGRIHGQAMTLFNRFGNWLFTHMVRQVYRANVTDVLTGYFAWEKQVIDTLRPHLQSKGFAIEMEMITKMSRMGYEIFSVPISYTQRAGDSNLHPVRDGARILIMFFKNLAWKPEKSQSAAIANSSESEKYHGEFPAW